MRFMSLIIFIMSFNIYALESNKCIKIGIIGEYRRPISKTLYPFGTEIWEGVNLSLNQLSNKNCFEPIKVGFDNSIANIPDAIKKANKNFGIKIFIGLGTTDQVFLALSALNEINGLLITPTASDDDINKLSNRVIMMYPRNSLIAKKIADIALKDKSKRVLVIYAKNIKYSNDMRRDFVEIMNRNGGKIASEIPLRAGNLNLNDILQKVKTIHYSKVFIPLFELDTAEIINFFVKNDLCHDFIGSDSWGTYSNVIEYYTNGMKYHASLPLIYDYNIHIKTNFNFVNKYRIENQGHNPEDLTAFSYDAMNLVQSMFKNGCNEDKIVSNIKLCAYKALPFYSTTGMINSITKHNFNRALTSRYIGNNFYEEKK